MAEPHIPPDANRRARARRAGLRPRVRWWVVAIQAVLLAALLAAATTGERVSRWLHQALTLAFEMPGGEVPGGSWAWALLVVPAVSLIAVLLVAAPSGALGPIRGEELKRLAPERRRPSAWLVGATLAVMAAAWAQFSPVAAAGARSVAGSEAILVELWHTWAVRILVGTAIVLGFAGLGELVLERHTIRRSLYRTTARARRDAQGERR